MMYRVFKAAVVVAVCCGGVSSWGAEGLLVNESARDIPIAHEVDVAIVGGGTGAVAAAVEAGEVGASVFLAAPYPYLGDDMTATLRLWLEEDETPEHPLARQIFTDPLRPATERLAFTYEANRVSNYHTDTDPPSLLTNGRWGSGAWNEECVQYDGDVTITADLGEAKEVEKARVVVYQRDETTSAGSGFNVDTIAVSISNDAEAWEKTAEVEGRSAGSEDFYILTTPIEVETRYVRFEMEKPAEYDRILLGEIELLGLREGVSPPPRPMHIKKTLDDALLEAGVEYLYSSMVTDVLRDAGGDPAGIVIANRAGRQAVVANTIIDATSRGQVARLAGAAFSEYPAGTHTFRRTVIGGEVQEGDNMGARIIEPPFEQGGDAFDVIEYTLELPMAEAGHASWMEADQKARTMTYDAGQKFTSDMLFQVPPDAMSAQEPADGSFEGVEELPLGALKPEGIRGMYVLGGCAGVPREHAGELLRPLALIDLGARVGAAAAVEASAMEILEGVHLPGDETDSLAAPGDVREVLDGPRPVDQSRLPVVSQQARRVPVLGQYDVVVIGGGTSGAPAGIAAGRQGADVLVVEYLYGLGGVGTEGAIASYWHGNRVGFTSEVQDGQDQWRIEPKKEWWRRELLDASAEIWLGSLGAGAFVEDQRVRGAVVVTPSQRGVVLADVIIDATGNSDVAAAAGAEIDYTGGFQFAMQSTGLPGLELSARRHRNTAYTMVDETDMADVWQMFVQSKRKAEWRDAFDHGRLIDTRERRRIVGDTRITALDQWMDRTYPDTIYRARSNMDIYGYVTHPYFLLEYEDREVYYTDVPYRAMLPKGLEGMLVVGLGISADRYVMAQVRMQADVQNGGYGAGVAAALAAQTGVTPREVDVRALQAVLVEIGNLPEEVLEQEDNYPMPEEKIAEAVKTLAEKDELGPAAVVLAHSEDALPLLREAYEDAAGDTKVIYAKALAILGDPVGLDTMLDELGAASEWDDGWNYLGGGESGRSHSDLDALIHAIGKTGEARALRAILEKAEMLTAGADFSHHRAVARALELIGDDTAAEPLAELLAKPGMSGHHQPDIETVFEVEVGRPAATGIGVVCVESLRELHLARALYRCGDHEGMGREILENYTSDLRGHFARHAQAVLEEREKMSADPCGGAAGNGDPECDPLPGRGGRS